MPTLSSFFKKLKYRDHYAFQKLLEEDPSLKTVQKFLKENGVDVNYCDQWGFTLLTLAINYIQWNKSNGRAIVKWLLDDKHADVNQLGVNSSRPLSLAIQQSELGIVKHLLERGANVHLKDRNTPYIRLAIFSFNNPKQQLECLKILVDYGADINEKKGQLDTHLIYAIRKQSIDIIKLLIKNGAQINLASQGNSPLSVAISAWFEQPKNKTSSDILRYLIQHGANFPLQILEKIQNSDIEKGEISIEVIHLAKFITDCIKKINTLVKSTLKLKEPMDDEASSALVSLVLNMTPLVHLAEASARTQLKVMSICISRKGLHACNDVINMVHDQLVFDILHKTIQSKGFIKDPEQATWIAAAWLRLKPRLEQIEAYLKDLEADLYHCSTEVNTLKR